MTAIASQNWKHDIWSFFHNQALRRQWWFVKRYSKGSPCAFESHTTHHIVRGYAGNRQWDTDDGLIHSDTIVMIENDRVEAGYD